MAHSTENDLIDQQGMQVPTHIKTRFEPSLCGFLLLFTREGVRIKLAMQSPEYLSSRPDQIDPKEEQRTTVSWESFVWQLLSKYPVEFDQGYPLLRVYMPVADRQLTVDIGDGTVRITYGHRAQYGVSPAAELIFDSTGEGAWTPIEVRYSQEMWQSFTRKMKAAKEPVNADEKYYSFDEFARYVLQLIQPQQWLEYGKV